MAAVAAATRLEKRNWLIHQLYVRKAFDECLELIEQQLHATRGLSEHALYIKGEQVPATQARPLQGTPLATHGTGLVLRQRGEIQESMQLFQAANFLNPKSPVHLKQVARSLCVPETLKRQPAAVVQPAHAACAQVPHGQAQGRSGCVQGRSGPA